MKGEGEVKSDVFVMEKEKENDKTTSKRDYGICKIMSPERLTVI